MIWIRLACISSLVLIFCFARESQAQIVGLGDLPGGEVFSRASGVSADGSVVVGTSSGANGQEAFRWTRDGGMQGIGDLPGGGATNGDVDGAPLPPAFSSFATSVSADGSVVVGSSNGVDGNEAFRWTTSDGIQGIGDLPDGFSFFSDTFSSRATAVTVDGSVVVGSGTGSMGREAFRWTSSAGIEGLGFLPGSMVYETRSEANDVSADGLVIVGESTGSNGREAFRWTNSGGMQGLGFFPGGSSSNAKAVSEDGSVVVGGGRGPDNGFEAFRWTSSGGMQGLGALQVGSPSFSFAEGVSADGSVVVGFSIGAFVWEAGTGMRSLFDVLTEQGDDLSNWTSLDVARAISADGRTVVGIGTNTSGFQEGFVATLNNSVLLGDVSLDETVNFLDIAPFISLLSSGGFQAEADVDESGEVDFLDISPFIEILIGS